MNKWKNSEIEFLKNNYDLMTFNEMASKLGRTSNAIKIKCSKLGLHKASPYEFDRCFFHNIDSEEKAYWFGFLYADGYVSYDQQNRNYEMGVNLQKSDASHLKKLNKSLHGNVSVKLRKRKNHICVDHEIKDKVCSEIRFYSKEMVEDLIMHGLVPNKSLTKKAPIGIDDSLMNHFIRGYFDGNGCITSSYCHKVDKSYIKAFICTGSKCYVEYLKEYLLNIVGIETFIVKGVNSFKLRVKSKDIKKFLNYMYADSTIYLDRKYNQYQNAVSNEIDK